MDAVDWKALTEVWQEIKEEFKSLPKSSQVRLLVYLFWFYFPELYDKAYRIAISVFFSHKEGKERETIKDLKTPRKVVNYLRKRLGLKHRFYPILLYIAQRAKHNLFWRERKKPLKPKPPRFRSILPPQDLLEKLKSYFEVLDAQKRKRFLGKLCLVYLGDSYYDLTKELEAYFERDIHKPTNKVAGAYFYFHYIPRWMFPMLGHRACIAKSRVYRRLWYLSKRASLQSQPSHQ